MIEQLHKAAEKAGLSVEQMSPHHFRIIGGAFPVDYYPLSRRRTAYVDGTNHGKAHVTPEQAVNMAVKAPPILPYELRSDRKTRKKSRIRSLFSRQNLCHWCRLPMQIENSEADDYATIEHVIPLARGGLDHSKNRVLAHAKCNHERGMDMPELRK
ncbi:MAG: HNH endonuclease domain-containing protein [Gammaproteobacteria bacterium]|nr:HNH endonuclease domain-containing protein [Gammaproteobacteria bacterium]